MTKEENQDTQKISTPQNEGHEKESCENLETSLDNSKDKDIDQDNLPKQTPEEKIIELEDKLARTFAEMENQRRRFEKEKDEAYEYGGFAFAKEALNLIDNLERSKQILENDETLKNSEALKKSIDHLNIIEKDLISIF